MDSAMRASGRAHLPTHQQCPASRTAGNLAGGLVVQGAVTRRAWLAVVVVVVGVIGGGCSGVDLPRLVRFAGASTLAGQADDPIEGLVSPFDVVDATTAIETGASLLVWMRPALEGRRFASLAAVEPSGDVVFLGGCKAAWTPAFAHYVEANGGGRPASEVLAAILVDPEGHEAATFLASAEASTPAGPTRG